MTTTRSRPADRPARPVARRLPLAQECVLEIRQGYPLRGLHRWTIAGIPREHEGSEPEEQWVLRETEPPLTGTPWDALVAAVVEHLARVKRAAPPDWTQRRERFVKQPEAPTGTDTEVSRLYRLAQAPAAFLRHGTPVDPRDLDERGGGRTHGRASGLSDPPDELLERLEEAHRAYGLRGHVYAVEGELVTATARALELRDELVPAGTPDTAELLAGVAGSRSVLTAWAGRHANELAASRWSTGWLVVTGVSRELASTMTAGGTAKHGQYEALLRRRREAAGPEQGAVDAGRSRTQAPGAPR